MLKFEMHSYQLPRWMVPVLALAALALIPFALMLALGVAVLAIGVSVLRAFLPSSPGLGKAKNLESPQHVPLKPGSIIDADYEVKDENEKE